MRSLTRICVWEARPNWRHEPGTGLPSTPDGWNHITAESRGVKPKRVSRAVVVGQADHEVFSAGAIPEEGSALDSSRRPAFQLSRIPIASIGRVPYDWRRWVKGRRLAGPCFNSPASIRLVISTIASFTGVGVPTALPLRTT